MKKIKIRKKQNNGPVTARVPIEFDSAQAQEVFIAGTFNDWRPEVTPMIALGKGRWRKELSLPPGTYEYCLVVDGEWLPDPKAAENIHNPFGTQNSVLKVSGSNGHCEQDTPTRMELASGNGT